MPAKPKAARQEPETKPPSKRGGARPGAGRKPKAVVEAKAETIARPASIALARTAPVMSEPIPQLAIGPEDRRNAAELAFALLVQTLTDTGMPLPLRLECAVEILNRAWGRPGIAPPVKEDKANALNLDAATDEELATLKAILERLDASKGGGAA